MQTATKPTPQDVLDALTECTTAGNVLTFPRQLDRALYTKVASALEAYSGKWNRKAGGFIFPGPASERLANLIESGDTNPVKTYQYFPTPDGLADYMLAEADMDFAPGMDVLEPSAGDGALVRAILRRCPDLDTIDTYEAWDVNRKKLGEIEQVFCLGADFMLAPDSVQYDRIVANPPFAKNQDIQHVRRMLALLKPGGSLVSVMSTHWRFAQDRESVLFRQIVEGISDHVTIIELAEGSFKESNTGVNTCLFIFHDPN